METFLLRDSKKGLHIGPKHTSSPTEQHDSFIQVEQELVKENPARPMEFHPYTTIHDKDTEPYFNLSVKLECLDDIEEYMSDTLVETSGGSYGSHARNQSMDEENLGQSIKREPGDKYYDMKVNIPYPDDHDDSSSEPQNSSSPKIDARNLKTDSEDGGSDSSKFQIDSAPFTSQKIGFHGHLVHQADSLTDELKALGRSYEDTEHGIMDTGHYCSTTTSGIQPRTESVPIGRGDQGNDKTNVKAKCGDTHIERTSTKHSPEQNQMFQNFKETEPHSRERPSWEKWPSKSNDHMMIHSKERPFKCSVCGKCFRFPHNLSAHMMMHTGEKPNKCEECGKCFALKDRLKRHMITHSKEKAHECEKCGKKYAGKHNLKRHMKSHKTSRSSEDTNHRIMGTEDQHKATSGTPSITESGPFGPGAQGMDVASVEAKHDGTRIEKRSTEHSQEQYPILQNVEETELDSREHQSSQKWHSKVNDPMMIHSEERPFKCNACGKCFRRLQNLSVHMMIHTGEKPYKCEECGNCFREQHKLKRHMLTHSGKKAYECEICQMKYASKHNLKRHMKTHKIMRSSEGANHLTMRPKHCCSTTEVIQSKTEPIPLETVAQEDCCESSRAVHPEFKSNFVEPNRLEQCVLTQQQGQNDLLFTDSEQQPYVCPECQKCFSQLEHLESHMITHSHKCTVCGKDFNESSKLRSHMTYHSENKPHKCTVCGKSFRYHSLLNAHVKTHTGEKPHVCNVCDNAYSTVFALKQHMRVHSGEKPYWCEICSKKFIRKSNLNSHMILHSAIKPHTCTECGKGFNRPFSLKNHMRTHTSIQTGETPFSCEICGENFRRIDYLWKHMITHAGLKPHMMSHTVKKPHICNLCGKNFHHLSGLRQHMNIHSGRKPHGCEICDKKFGTKALRRRHMTTHVAGKPHKCVECGKAYKDYRTLNTHIKINHTKVETS